MPSGQNAAAFIKGGLTCVDHAAMKTSCDTLNSSSLAKPDGLGHNAYFTSAMNWLESISARLTHIHSNQKPTGVQSYLDGFCLDVFAVFLDLLF